MVDKYLSSLSFAFTHLLQVSSTHNFYHFISLSSLSSSAFSSTSCLERIRSPATLHSVGGEGREVALKVYAVSLSLYSLSSGYSTVSRSLHGLLSYFYHYRRQVPIASHTSQGRTFQSAVLNLEKLLPPPPTTEHQTFCSEYLILSRLQTLTGLHLLRPISLNCIQSRPQVELLE